MPTSNSRFFRSLLLAGLLAPTVAGAGVMSSDGSTLLLPDFAASAPAGFVATEVQVKVECGGVSGVSGVPDVWEFDYRRRGDSGLVRIVLPEDARSVPLDSEDRSARLRSLQGVRISVIHRGQWSDCFSAWVTLNGFQTGSGGEPQPAALHFGPHPEGLDRWHPVLKGRRPP